MVRELLRKRFVYPNMNEEELLSLYYSLGFDAKVAELHNRITFIRFRMRQSNVYAELLSREIDEGALFRLAQNAYDDATREELV